MDDDAKQATVIVPDDQLSLAIGKDGLNARLAARLTGWRVDIRSETEFAEEEAEMRFEEEGAVRALRRDPRQRQALPERRAARARATAACPPTRQLADKDGDYVVPPDEGGDGGEPEPEEEPAETVVAGAEPTGAEEAAPEAPPEEAPAAQEPEPSAGDGAEPVPETTAEDELEPSRGGQG